MKDDKLDLERCGGDDVVLYEGMGKGFPNKIIFEKRPERNKGTGCVYALFQVCSGIVFLSVHLMR